MNTLKKAGFISLIAILILSISCKRTPKSEEAAFSVVDTVVTPDIETQPVISVEDEDAADDPAIWIHPVDRSKSTIIGTNKKGGLCVYDLAGNELFYYPDGNMNNVDVRYNFPLNGEKIDIAAASNRTNNSVSVYKINRETGALENIVEDTLFSDVIEIYGFCLYQSPVNGKTYAFANGKTGMVEQWELLATENNKITGKVVRTFELGEQPEGMVADDELSVLYIGEENHCIWKYGAEPTHGITGNKVAMSDSTNSNIVYDIEGLSIYYADSGKGYLIASIQGSFSYAVFERAGENKYLFNFSIKDSETIDGVEETDGLDVLNVGLGEKFPNGIFVVQDGFNYDGDEKKNQNFKAVSWDKIAHLTNPPLIIDNTYDVRKANDN